MPRNELVTNAAFFHLRAGSFYSSAQNTNSVDLSQYSGGVVLLVNILSVVTDTCEFIVQHSDDNSVWEATGLGWVEPVTAVAHSSYAFVHRNKVKRYVRLRFIPAGTINGSSVNGIGFGQINGAAQGLTYAADSGI